MFQAALSVAQEGYGKRSVTGIGVRTGISNGIYNGISTGICTGIYIGIRIGIYIDFIEPSGNSCKFFISEHRSRRPPAISRVSQCVKWIEHLAPQGLRDFLGDTKVGGELVFWHIVSAEDQIKAGKQAGKILVDRLSLLGMMPAMKHRTCEKKTKRTERP